MNSIYLGRLVKVFWMFSLIVFLGVLLYVYVKLPPFISLTKEQTSFKFMNFEKSTIFYWSLTVFILSNIAWYLIVRVLGNISSRSTSDSKKFLTRSKISALVNWLNGFSSLINIIIILSLLFLNILFSENKRGLDQIVNVIYGFLILIGVWFLVLGFLVAKNEKSEPALEA